MGATDGNDFSEEEMAKLQLDRKRYLASNYIHAGIPVRPPVDAKGQPIVTEMSMRSEVEQTTTTTTAVSGTVKRQEVCASNDWYETCH
jgi:hypothetical protein